MAEEHFKVKSVINLEEVKVGDVIPTSDFASVTPNGLFVQLAYEEEKFKKEPYKVYPGIYTIKKTMSGLKLEETSFVTDNILSSFVSTDEIVNKVKCFRRNLHHYKKYGIEIPSRKLLLFGPAGSGKSTSIIEVSRQCKDDKTCIILWPTDKFEAFAVKDFIKTFQYEGVDFLMMFVEDIGGVEVDQTRQASDSSLLSLLDNKEKTFKVANFIIATTNFPENFLGNLTNRPGRFDDKMEVGYPSGQQRKELVKFFGKEEINETDAQLITSDKYKEFTPAHIQDIFLCKDIYEMSFEAALNSIASDIEHYNKGFSKRKKMGMISDYE